jgi:bacterioferritin-associated ferredoxin
MIICACNVVREDEIRTEVRLGAGSADDVAVRCGAGARCGTCRPAVVEIVADEAARADSAVSTAT